MEALGALLPRLQTAVPGPRSQASMDSLALSECPALTQRRARRSERSGAPQDPIVWAEARGSNVLDADGNVFVDLSAGFGAASIGHAHPRLQACIAAQSARLLHALGDLHPSEAKVALLSRLTQSFAYPTRAMLGLSGSDAVEAALKTALLCTGRPGVLAFEGGYHGLSHGPLAACGYSAAFRAPFSAQLNPHVRFAAYPGSSAESARSLEQAAALLRDGSLGAVLVEPILGRGGVVVPPGEFLPQLAALAREHGALLIVDEIMTGLGRCGAMFAHAELGLSPDLVCLGKALGGGLPVSACIGRAELMQAWGDPGREALHTGTFFGQPLACAAALTTLDVLRDEGLAEQALRSQAFLARALSEVRARRSQLRAVRGKGLLIGLEFESGAFALRLGRALLEAGYITVPAGADARVISLTPPLSIHEAQLSGFVAALDDRLAVLS